MAEAAAIPARSASARLDVPIERIEVSAYTIPTDFPESDGTLARDSTTLVLVEAAAGGERGLGFTYAGTSSARLIHDRLAEVVRGRDALAVPDAWAAMISSVRNLGRPGIASTAIAASGYGALESQGAPARPATGPAPGRGARERAGLRQRRLHLLLRRPASAGCSRPAR